MSHNYPFRRQPPPLMSLGARRADLGPYSSADHRHATPDHDFCIQHEEPPARLLSSSFPPSHSSSLSSSREQWSADSGLNILSSCGLEPSDLSVLAELPEDVLTVESLPHVLREIKGKRVTSKPRQPIAPGTPAPFPASLARRPPSPPSDDWDRLRSPVMNLPVDPPGMMSGPLVSERDDRWQDRWENPRCTTSAIYTPSSRADPVVSPPSSSYMVEYNHQVRRPEYGMDKEEDSSSFGYIPGGGQRSLGGRGHSSLFSHSESHDNNPALLLDNYRPKTQQLEASSRKRQSHGGSSQPIGAAKIPSKKQALDFHGTTPEVYPYTCCLCDITVLSEMGWLKHINGANHADGQLTLLQRFPNWDCRMETVTRALEQQKDKEASVQQNTNSQSNKSSKKHSSEKRSVVCIKFPTNSVDEQYLRKLVEPFGELVKIVMFPSVAYVELATSDQAMDMVNFHNKYSTTVGDQKIEFSVSSTFNFIQDLRVLSFTPAPGGPNGQSDLIRIVKRFGPPLYMLFLPSVAFVEMKKAADAQNVVDYYSPTNLRINNKFIKVAFSGEYRTLARVPSAKSCEEETTSAKRTRSLSREKGDKRRRSSSKSSDNKDKQKEDGKSSKEMRSRSKDRSSSSSFKDKDNKKEEEKSNRERTSTSKEKTSSNSSKEKKTVEQASRSKDRSSSSYSKAHDKNTEKKSKDKSSNNSGKEKNNKTDEKSSKERSRSKEKTSSSSAKDDNKKKEEQRSRSKEKTSSTLSKDEDKKKEEQRSRSKDLTKNTEEMSKDKSSSSSLKEDKQKEEMCSKERSKPEEKSSKNEDKQKEERSMSREKSSSISSKEEGKKKEDSKSGKERTSGLEDKPSTVSSKDTVEKDRDKLKRESRSGSSDKSSSKSSTENTSGECVMIQKTEKDGSRADKTPPGMQKGSPKDGVVGEDGDAVLAVVEKSPRSNS
ncbi:matrin 3-like 1.1 [Thalassophryne amazonica]|uniref:matrin 3-like 1.1 n=1 Tax=Thalassophryne amazonica TaxID=390379 RepID=UPI00147129E0|nr:matrin 3-like 1.1 [Thalassophryne amazonica]